MSLFVLPWRHVMTRDHTAKTHLVCLAFRLAEGKASGKCFMLFFVVLGQNGRFERASYDKSVCNGCWLCQRPSKTAFTSRTLAVWGSVVNVLIATWCRSGLSFVLATFLHSTLLTLNLLYFVLFPRLLWVCFFKKQRFLRIRNTTR